ncbi:diguanylate cyclase [Clostridium sp. D2Q-11]|uniref:Diguanylate cyclase n=1 Tax=Anaeromonas frigoriresistens TaxID=2683708 RepID=A0A942UV86_9FIRM|nr:GGDEF domain-containing protein [Anaeromonas frigoriresistens]MBS4538650.1 diguanylate cyclase [Anaeromonas frigoriresistens]
MIDSFFTNIVSIVSFLFFSSIIDFKFESKNTIGSCKKSIYLGIIYGLLGIVLMHFSIPLVNNSIMDLRHLAILIPAIYIGSTSAFISTIIISLGRLLLFGFTTTSFISSIFMIVLGLVAILISKSKTNTFIKINYMNITSLLIIFVPLSINVNNWEVVFNIYPLQFFISIIAGLLIHLTADYIYKYIDNLKEVKFKSSQLNSLIKNLNSGIVFEDINRKLILVNQKFLNIFELDINPEDLIGTESIVFARSTNNKLKKDYYINDINTLVENKKIILNEELHLNNGKILERDFIPIFIDDEYMGQFWNLRDVTNKKLIEKKLKELSRIDGLTGIPNRRTFDVTLEREWNRSLRMSSSLSLIMLDIDNFKLYNDTYGHLAGDECLKKVAKTLSSAIRRPGDLAARYGGEEFAIILPSTDKNGAMHIAEEIRLRISDLKIPHSSSQVSEYVTISIGVTTMKNRSTSTPKELINRADKALYMSKDQGKNKVSYY